MNEQDGNGQSMEQFRIPDFIINMVGQLQIQNAALLAQVAALQLAPLSAVPGKSDWDPADPASAQRPTV